MTQAAQLRVSPVPSSIDNVGDWDGIARQIAAEAGLPTAVTPEMVTGMIGSGVPLLFDADAAKDMDLLRGTFAAPVIAQCQRNTGCLRQQRPSSVAAHLIGSHVLEGRPVLRTHLSIELAESVDGQNVTGQFWDLELGAQTTVGRASCPNCGAPIATGALICGHCQADVRTVVEVPLIVSRLELY
jgi:zinc-ribbon domain